MSLLCGAVQSEQEEETRAATGQHTEHTDLEAICLHARGIAHSMTVKAQAERMEKRQR